MFAVLGAYFCVSKVRASDLRNRLLRQAAFLFLSCVLPSLCLTQAARSTTLTSIQVRPGSASVALGNQRQYVAWGTYSNGVTKQLSSVTWQCSAPSVATLNSSGMAATTAQGSATVSATSGSISGSASLTVTPPIVKSV